MVLVVIMLASMVVASLMFVLTAEQMAALDARKKERDARCKPEADRRAQIQREILAAQQ